MNLTHVLRALLHVVGVHWWYGCFGACRPTDHHHCGLCGSIQDHA